LAGEIAMTALGWPEKRKHASGGPMPGYDATRAAVTAGHSHTGYGTRSGKLSATTNEASKPADVVTNCCFIWRLGGSS
jgi:hypothetical protein